MIAASELLSPAQFQEELRHVLRFREHPAIADPLASALERIEKNPAFAQSRLLTRILVALTYQEGAFRRAEIGSLDAETFAMVITLMDAFASASPPRSAWVRAVDSARAAEQGAGA